MAKGYPDFFGTSIWPKYGAPIRTGAGSVNVPAGTGVDIIDISSTGVFFFANIVLTTVGDYALSHIDLEIDDQLMWSWWIDFDKLPTSLGGAQELMAITYCNKVNSYIYVVLSREIPFQHRIKIQVTNASASDIVTVPRTLHYVVT